MDTEVFHRASRISFSNGSDNITGYNLQTSGMAREANDAVSAYTQVSMSEAPRLPRLLEK